MNNLENLVPPLELCKRIPAGEFEDSALVWHILDCTGTQYLLPREAVGWGIKPAELAPAPTLDEILKALSVGDEFFETFSPALYYNKFLGGWVVNAKKGQIVDSMLYTDVAAKRDSERAVTAALRVFLEVYNAEADIRLERETKDE